MRFFPRFKVKVCILIDSWGGGAFLQTLKGVGHWHCIEAGDEIGKMLVDFAVDVENEKKYD